MDLSGLIDMNYFWWALNKILAFAIPFLVIFVAVAVGGFLLSTLTNVFRKMNKG